MTQLTDHYNIGLEGHVHITSYDANHNDAIVLLNKRNAIHREHASIVIAGALANRSTDGSIYSMHFGTGGATVDPLGGITYASTNTTGAADLHVPVYFEIVDDTLGASSGNQMAVKHINGQLFSDVEVRAVIGQNEPFGQAATDTASGSNINTTQFVFDEIGLKTSSGLLFSHVIFSPIQKAASRVFEIVYTIRVTVSA